MAAPTGTGPVDWKGLFEWSMKQQEAPRAPKDEGGGEGPKLMSEQDRKWFEEAMEHYSLDITKRMKEIKRQLDAVLGGGGSEGEKASDGASVAASAASANDTTSSPPPPLPTPATPAELEELLEELIETVEDVDCARDLALIGGLPTLLALLRAGAASTSTSSSSSKSPPPSPRLITSGVVSRAAEVLGAAAQANPPVQDWFLDGGAMEAVLGLLREKEGGGEEEGAKEEEEEKERGGGKVPSPSPPSSFVKADTERTAEVRQKALMALSCLARNCDRGTDALIASGGVRTVVEHALAAVGEEEAAVAEEKKKETTTTTTTKATPKTSSSSPVPAPRVARKAFQLLASLFRDRPTEGCLSFSLTDPSFARAAARALRDQNEKEQGGEGDVRLAAAAAVEALAKAASKAGIPLEPSSPSSSSSSSVSIPLLLRAALETAESCAKERAAKAARSKDEHARDWAEEEAAAAAAALGALSLKPKEKKSKKEEEKKPAVVLSLPAPAPAP